MTDTLNDRLRGTVEMLSGVAPPQLFGVFAAEQQRLAAGDRADGRVAVGDVIADVTLPDAHGRPVSVPGGRPVVIVFYRGAWCPYCNVALAAYQREVLPAAREAGVDFVAVSPQGPDGSLTVAQQNELTFPVLTDHGGGVARSLGIAFDLADDVQAAQLEFGNDFTSINSGGEWALPKPTVLVVDADRVVRFVNVRPDYTQRTEPSAVLAAIAALG